LSGGAKTTDVRNLVFSVLGIKKGTRQSGKKTKKGRALLKEMTEEEIDELLKKKGVKVED
jgi:hypothetical protein